MENVTQSLKNETHSLLYWAKVLAEALVKPQQSFLNVSREDVVIYRVIKFVKHAMVWYGLSNIVSPYVTLKMLVMFSFFIIAGGCVMNLIFMWASWSTLLCFNSDVMNLPAAISFLTSQILLAVNSDFLFFNSSLDLIVDIFCVVYVTFYTLEAFWGPVRSFLEFVLVEATTLFSFYAIDLFFEADGLVSEMMFLHTCFLPLIIDAFVTNKMGYFIVMSSLFAYCALERISMDRS